MNKIDAQIQWIAANATNYHDDIVMIEFDKINQLYAKYQEQGKEIFVHEILKAFYNIIEIQRETIEAIPRFASDEADVDKIISAFCNMIKTQRELICCLEQEDENLFDHSAFMEQPWLHGYTANMPNIADESKAGFQNDEQLQNAFTAYCLNDGKSSYTANDYCSRIKSLWKNFYNEYEENSRDGYNFIEEKIIPNSPLLNVYNQAEFFFTFIEKKIIETDGNRNWTNARAAFNKFDEFRMTLENK